MMFGVSTAATIVETKAKSERRKKWVNFISILEQGYQASRKTGFWQSQRKIAVFDFSLRTQEGYVDGATGYDE